MAPGNVLSFLLTLKEGRKKRRPKREVRDERRVVWHRPKALTPPDDRMSGLCLTINVRAGTKERQWPKAINFTPFWDLPTHRYLLNSVFNIQSSGFNNLEYEIRKIRPEFFMDFNRPQNILGISDCF